MSLAQAAYSAPVLAFLIVYVALRGLLSRFARFALDHPNERSLHSVPVPRTGGLAIMVGVAAGWAVGGGVTWPLWLCGGLLLLVSLLDDVRSLPVAVRLLLHIAVAWGFVAFEVIPDAGIGWMLLAALAVIWLTNLYNFMDGMDGLAGGMSLFGFLFYGLAAWLSGNQEFALINLVISAAASAFLLFNFYPARIFMGDSGSIPLGFFSAALGLLGWRDGLWPLWFPLWVFSPFILDASVTLAKRLWRGEKVWRAHREHYYQCLVQMGWKHSAVARLEYGLMLVAGGSALLALSLGHKDQGLLALFVFSMFLGGMLVVDIYWKRFSRLQKHAETKRN